MAGGGASVSASASASASPSASASASASPSPSQGMGGNHGDAAATSLSDSKLSSETSHFIFGEVWSKLEQERGRDNLIFPREIVWLNGAPGSGKGVTTPFIMEARGFDNVRPIEVSKLMEEDPECRGLMDAGSLVPDAKVFHLLCEALLNPAHGGGGGAGAVVDGFPRTAAQVDCLKLLFDKLLQRHISMRNVPKPAFRVVVLYVDEATSVQRQLTRGKRSAWKKMVIEDATAGKGVVSRQGPRATDLDEERVRKRYQVFRENYGSLLRLRDDFPFTLLNAIGTVAECQAQIVKELRYQSSMDLDEDTYRAISKVPMMYDVCKNTRAELVSRLEGYRRTQEDLFLRVISVIEQEVAPLMRAHATSGKVRYYPTPKLGDESGVDASLDFTESMFDRSADARDILVDVLSERGYRVVTRKNATVIPTRVDLTTGVVTGHTRFFNYSFDICFPRAQIRDHHGLAVQDSSDIFESENREMIRNKLHDTRVM